MASLFQNLGLTLTIYEQPWRGGKFLRSYNDEVKNYGHDMGAVGGFLGCSFELADQPFNDFEDWIESGLGREVKITSAGGSVFEGFINRLEFTIEGFHVVYGPLMDVVNKARLQYSVIDWSTGQAVTGLQATTGWFEDLNSQTKYGIHTKVLSSGGIQPDLVDELVQQVLKKLAKPKSSEDLSFASGSGGPFSIRVVVEGWYSWLDKYVYNSTDTTMVNLSAKLKAIIAIEPNNLFNSGLVQTNTLQVSLWENDSTSSWGQMKALLAFGDANFDRYILGVYENRIISYKKVEDVITYYRPLKEKLTSVLDTQQNLVDPWLVRPGVWVNVMDLMPTYRAPALESAMDTMFIESVNFKAPNSLTLNGSNIYKLEQRLAQLGISGLGI